MHMRPEGQPGMQSFSETQVTTTCFLRQSRFQAHDVLEMRCNIVVLSSLLLLHAACAASLKILPFELSDVQLAGSTFQAKAAASNSHYLLETLDVDRLLWSFRKTAGLPQPGQPYAGSWEDPYCELRGHFVGHYLSALAFLVQSTGNAQGKERLDLMVSELAKCQKALNNGYLSAFPSEHFDRVEALEGVWAPYYVIHKIMAGLVDAYQLTGNQQALEVVSAMADYFYTRTAKVIKEQGRAHWDQSLETEFGGMNDILYRLYRITKKDTHLQLAGWFDKPVFYNGLKQGRDVLQYHHANTHLAQVVGFAERYETTDEEEAKEVVTKFFNMVTTNHTFATGGSNWKEFWHQPGTLGDAILKGENAIETQEICTQYNILKIARALFRWTGDVKYADFYERALVNGILGVSRLSSDEVLGQEEDNLEYLQKLLHKHTGHDHSHEHGHGVAGHRLPHHHHHHHHGMLGQGAGRQLQAGRQSDLLKGGDGATQSVEGTGMHLGGHGDTGSLSWTIGDPATLKGDLDTNRIPANHFHRAGAAGRGNPKLEYQSSMAHEPSWHATTGGQLLHPPYQTGVPAGTVAPWQRQASWVWQNFWGYNLKLNDPDGQTNVPGTPGSFLYLLTLGTGVSKRENKHHWGYPIHSFWCCYGTAVESFAKLGDSVYFWSPGKNVDNSQAGLGDAAFDDSLPVLWVNQYVSSTLAWKDMGLRVQVKATMYGEDTSMSANITLDALDAATSLAAHAQDIPFTLKLRVPTWARKEEAGGKARVTINGKVWSGDNIIAAGYITMTRRWRPSDSVQYSVGLQYWMSPLTDTRPQFADYAAFMMGPYVMAGLTHDASWITLSSQDLASQISEPPVTSEGLISLQAAANASLYLRHDHYHSYVSEVQDSGDALDATFILRSGCPLGGARDGSDTGVGQQLLSTGLTEGQVVMIEAMGQPGFFLGALASEAAHGKLVWEQKPSTVALGKTTSKRHPGDISNRNSQETAGRETAGALDQMKGWCDHHSWRVVRGLDGSSETISLELVGKSDHYLTGVISAGSHKCEDLDPERCRAAAHRGLCASKPERWLPQCLLSCQYCKQLPAALHLVHIPKDSATGSNSTTTTTSSSTSSSRSRVIGRALSGGGGGGGGGKQDSGADDEGKQWASWRWVAPATPRYPPGAKVVEGLNRKYLLAPIGNLVDERYTVYFHVKTHKHSTSTKQSIIESGGTERGKQSLDRRDTQTRGQ